MPQPSLPTWPVRDFAEPADLRVDIHPGVPPVVEICGEIDIESATPLRDELLRVVRGTPTRAAAGPGPGGRDSP